VRHVKTRTVSIDNCFEPLALKVALLRKFGVPFADAKLALETLPLQWNESKRLGTDSRERFAPTAAMHAGRVKEEAEEVVAAAKAFRARFSAGAPFDYSARDAPYAALDAWQLELAALQVC